MPLQVQKRSVVFLRCGRDQDVLVWRSKQVPVQHISVTFPVGPCYESQSTCCTRSAFFRRNLDSEVFS